MGCREEGWNLDSHWIASVTNEWSRLGYKPVSLRKKLWDAFSTIMFSCWGDKFYAKWMIGKQFLSVATAGYTMSHKSTKCIHKNGQMSEITQNYGVWGFFPSSVILETRKHDVSETGSVSVLR
jgi:hypothetical protein